VAWRPYDGRSGLQRRHLKRCPAVYRANRQRRTWNSSGRRDLALRIKLPRVSEHNVELFRRLVEAYSARDIEEFIACCDPKIEFHAAWSVPGGTVYHGPDGLRRWHQEHEDAWLKIRAEPEAFYDLGDQTLVFATLHARGRQSSAKVTMFNAMVAKWRNGLCVELRAYVDRKEALVDLDITEDTLEPIAP
jgi:ketosteroid isomerase-like protein